MKGLKSTLALQWMKVKRYLIEGVEMLYKGMTVRAIVEKVVGENRFLQYLKILF